MKTVKFYRYVIWFCALILLTTYGLSTKANENGHQLTIDDMGLAELEYNVETFKSSTENLHAQNEYNAARIKHQKELMAIAEKAYCTQQVITVFIFIIVTILVLGGLWLSYLQFKADITKQKTEEDGKPQASFKISKDGVEFTSSVIGLIVLFMSFFFFHLYVKDVYTIKTHKIAPLAVDSEPDESKKNTK